MCPLPRYSSHFLLLLLDTITIRYYYQYYYQYYHSPYSMSQPIHTKYTTRSTGVWELIRKWLVLVPNRSSGNPLVSLYRKPAPGGQPGANTFQEPVTIPAGDIVKNTYYARDYRRNYPRVSAVDQAKVAGLLTLGSRDHPRIAKGAEGESQVAVFQDGGAGVSLVDAIKAIPTTSSIGSVVVAPGLGIHKGEELKRYVIVKGDHGMYDDSYPVRMFNFK